MLLPMLLAFLGTVLLHATATRAPKAREWQRWLGQHPVGSRAVGALLWTLGLLVAASVDGPAVGLVVVSATTMLALPALSLSIPWWPQWSWRSAPIAATAAMFVALWGWL